MRTTERCQRLLWISFESAASPCALVLVQDAIDIDHAFQIDQSIFVPLPLDVLAALFGGFISLVRTCSNYM